MAKAKDNYGHPSGRSWSAERAERKGGSNIRGNKKQDWERSYVKPTMRTNKKSGKRTMVKGFFRHKHKFLKGYFV